MTDRRKRQTRFIAVLVAAVGLVGGCAGTGSRIGSEPSSSAAAATVTASACGTDLGGISRR